FLERLEPAGDQAERRPLGLRDAADFEVVRMPGAALDPGAAPSSDKRVVRRSARDSEVEAATLELTWPHIEPLGEGQDDSLAQSRRREDAAVPEDPVDARQ